MIDAHARNEPEEFVAVLVAIADAAPDNAALAQIGAGPIEDMVVRCSDSKVVMDRIEGAAHRNEPFRKALRSAWFDERVPATVTSRLRASGSPSRGRSFQDWAICGQDPAVPDGRRERYPRPAWTSDAHVLYSAAVIRPRPERMPIRAICAS